MTITYNNIIDIFRNFQVQHLQLGKGLSFGYGDVNSLGQFQNINYPMMFVSPDNGGSILKDASADLSFNILLMDRLQDSGKNEQEVHSDMMSIASELRKYLANSASDLFSINTESRVLPFTERFGDYVGGWNLQCAISAEWDFSICQIPGVSTQEFNDQGQIIIPNYSNLLGNYMPLSGGTFTGCVYAPCLSAATFYSGSTPLTTIIQNIASQYSASTDSISYIFSGDNNFLISTGGTNPQLVTHSLNSNVSISNLTIGSSISGDSITANLPSATFNMSGGRILGLSNITTSAITVANNIISGSTNLNDIFSPTGHTHYEYSLTSHTHSDYSLSSHTHSLAQITATAHTHSISDVNNLSSQLNTKADLSGATFSGNISVPTLTATTYFSGASPITNFFLSSASTEVSYYRKRGSNLTRWYHSGVNAVTNSTVSLAKDVIHYMPFIVPVTQTIILIACEVTIFGTASAVARLGIFDSITNTSSIYHMQPNNVIADCGTVAIDSNGVKSIGSLSITLTPGLYFLTINHNSTSNTTFRSLGAAACPTLFAMSTSMGAANTNHLTENQTFGAFVASTNNAIAAVSSLPPIVAVQIG